MADETCEASPHNIQTVECVADKIAGINLKLLPGLAAHKADTLLPLRAKRVSTTTKKIMINMTNNIIADYSLWPATTHPYLRQLPLLSALP